MRRFTKLGLTNMAWAASSLTLAVGIAVPAFAQSTGTLDFDKEIVVTAKADKGIGGVVSPDSSKAKGELNQAWIQHQVPGQSLNDMINYLPGVSFTNADPYGGTSGTLYIRGFDATRVSETFDGVTLNDDGNYALYSGELLDSEVIDKVTVNLGTTDVDSPTSSASGSTVNFTSHMPSDKMGAKFVGALGTDAYYRAFGMLETGILNSTGTKAWVSASKTYNESPYDNYAKIRKHEFNGKIYQPLGGNGDFISLAGFYVVLRNQFSGSDPISNLPLAADTGLGLQYFPTNYTQAYYRFAPCTLSAATAGVADKPNTCGTAFDYRNNPANLMNIRAAMKVTLSPKLVWTADPSYQFTKANGGGTVSAVEGFAPASVVGAADTTGTGFINGTYYLGKDLNGDGDLLDKVTMLAPSETKTHRVALTTSLRYDVSGTQTIRLAYAFARSDITQSGEMGFVNADGSAANVYPVDAPVLDSNGNPIEKRDTESIAMLNQIGGEYKGKFFDNRLTATIGLRAPFLHRELTNYCFTRNGAGSSSSVTCAFGATAAAYAALPANVYAYNATTGVATGVAAPQTRTYNYSAVLPNVGFTYKMANPGELFFNYSKGMSAPQTLSLYPSFYYPQGTPGAAPGLEKTDNFDMGYRYNASKLTTQVDLWYTHYTNRLGSSYDAITQTTFYSNLGTVNRYGIDANVGYKFTPKVSGYLFGSWLHSKIQNNVDSGACASASAVAIAAGQISCVGTEAYLQTAGKFESGPPKYTVGGRFQAEEGPMTLGMEVKHTGSRYLDDENVALVSSGNALVTNGTVVYAAKTPEYTVVDADVRFNLTSIGLPEKSYLQLNVTNLFNTLYVGNFAESTTALQTGGTTAQVSPPRAFIASLSVAF